MILVAAQRPSQSCHVVYSQPAPKLSRVHHAGRVDLVSFLQHADRTCGCERGTARMWGPGSCQPRYEVSYGNFYSLDVLPVNSGYPQCTPPVDFFVMIRLGA